MNKLIGIATVSLVSLLGCGGMDGDGSPDATLSEAEEARLVFTREEEKLARDVYMALDSYGAPFTNIQDSEQRHFDSMGQLLVSYGLEDPAAGQGVGEFADPKLRDLYAQLVAQGAPSQLAALTVGCAIEDLDLRDLEVGLAETDAADITAVYENLSLGSRNHLRAFYGQLTAAGGRYTPQYLDQATFDAIVSSPTERGGR